MTRETYVPENPHILGDPRAPITVVEFGDMECPNCQAAAPRLRHVVESSAGGVRLVWRHFPLFEVHPYALTAALAAEAAGDRFWEMQELLLINQDRLADPDLASYAERLGIDGGAVIGEAAQRFAPIVQRDYALGLELGVPGTPALYVNGVRYDAKITLEGITNA